MPNLQEIEAQRGTGVPKICYVRLQVRVPRRVKPVAFGMQIISIPLIQFPHPWPSARDELVRHPDVKGQRPCMSLTNLKYLVMKSVYADQFKSLRYSQEVSSLPVLPSLNFEFLSRTNHSLGEVVLSCNHDLWCALGTAHQDDLRISLIATWERRNDHGTSMGAWIEDMDFEEDVPILFKR